MKAHGVVDDRLALLKGVSGSFRPGVLTALMGVSGAEDNVDGCVIREKDWRIH